MRNVPVNAAKIALVLVALHSSWAVAADVCRDAFEENRIPSRTAPLLIGTSNIYDPFTLTKQNQVLPFEGYVRVDTDANGTPQSSRFIAYRDPLSAMTLESPATQTHDAGLAAVYSAYENVIPAHVIEDIRATEKDVPVSRVLTYSVRSPENETRGFVRVFDGSKYPKQGSVPYSKFYSDASLPLELLLKAQNKRAEIVAADRRQGFSVFEIGKVMIAKDANLRERLEVRKMMVNWFRENIIAEEREDKTVFYADVESEVHRAAYERWFGFKVVSDPLQNGGVKPPAYLLRVTLKDLKQNL